MVEGFQGTRKCRATGVTSVSLYCSIDMALYCTILSENEFRMIRVGRRSVIMLLGTSTIKNMRAQERAKWPY